MRNKRNVYIVCLSLAVLAVFVSFRNAADGAGRSFPVGADGEAYHVLVLGKDDASGLTDVMMLVSVDVQNGRACLMQIPRDTYFRYTENNYRKINGAMHALGGAEALSKMLESALSTSIDSYVVMDLDFVEQMVDLLGGVPMDVPCDMDYDDPAQDLSIHLKQGYQTLTGAQAVQFIRYRSGYLRGDIERIDAQKLFMAAFFQTANERLGESDLSKLALAAMRSVKTDMRPDRVLSLLRGARSVAPENITIVTLPGEEVRSEISGAWYYVASRTGLAEVLETQFGVVGASACTDPAHLFGNVKREEFERVYRSNIAPRYFIVGTLQNAKS